MEDKKYYGILFEVFDFSADLRIYRPKFLIKGTYIDESLEGLPDGKLFRDEIGNYFLNLFQSLELGGMDVVDFIISEEELLEDYKSFSPEDAMKAYFNSHLGKIYFGCMDPDNFGLFSMNEDEITEHIIFDITNFEKSLKQKLNRMYENAANLENIDNMKEELKSINLYLESIELEKEGLTEREITSVTTLINELNSLNDMLIKSSNIYAIRGGITEIECEQLQTPEANLKKTKLEFNKELKDINIMELKEHLDSVVIGQEEAKKDVITTIIKNSLVDNKQERNACLLIGPTGSGKTLIFETISKYLDKPLLIIDTTQLSVPGYIGTSIEDYLNNLVASCNGDIKKAEQAIVVFDEIDKKGSKSNGDVGGKGVLNCLLSFLQGTTYLLSKEAVNLIDKEEGLFDTSNLTVFATGAFTDVIKNKKNKLSKNTIGFNNNSHDKVDENLYLSLDADDFTEEGEIPIELIGRFDTITALKEHDSNSLKEILLNSKLSPLQVENKKLDKLGVKLFYNNDYIDTVVKKALKLKTGARSLKSIVNLSLREAEWQVICNPDKYREIHLNDKTVEDNKFCILNDKNGNKALLSDIIDKEDKESSTNTKKLIKRK